MTIVVPPLPVMPPLVAAEPPAAVEPPVLAAVPPMLPKPPTPVPVVPAVGTPVVPAVVVVPLPPVEVAVLPAVLPLLLVWPHPGSVELLQAPAREAAPSRMRAEANDFVMRPECCTRIWKRFQVRTRSPDFSNFCLKTSAGGAPARSVGPSTIRKVGFRSRSWLP